MLCKKQQDNIPLLVPWVQPNLQDAERLKSPEHQPRLARILADVSRGEPLHKIPDEELHVCVLLQSWERFDAIGDVFEQNGLRFRLGLRCQRRERVCGGWGWMAAHYGGDGQGQITIVNW